jgi:hypothetical protein
MREDASGLPGGASRSQSRNGKARHLLIYLSAGHQPAFGGLMAGEKVLLRRRMARADLANKREAPPGKPEASFNQEWREGKIPESQNEAGCGHESIMYPVIHRPQSDRLNADLGKRQGGKPTQERRKFTRRFNRQVAVRGRYLQPGRQFGWRRGQGRREPCMNTMLSTQIRYRLQVRQSAGAHDAYAIARMLNLVEHV